MTERFEVFVRKTGKCYYASVYRPFTGCVAYYISENAPMPMKSAGYGKSRFYGLAISRAFRDLRKREKR